MNTSIIKFVGIGSEGCQAVECIMKNKSENVSFALCNTEEKLVYKICLAMNPEYCSWSLLLEWKKKRICCLK